MNPNTPTTYDEIADDAIRCWEAGAGAIHAHNTSFDLLGENAYKDYMRTWEKVLAKHPGITWYPTTCNNLRLVGDENGLEHVLYLNDNAHAEIACVDTGLTLFATGRDEDGYLQGPEFGFNYQRVASQWRMLRERGIPMVYGVYEPGHLRRAVLRERRDVDGQGEAPLVHLDLGAGALDDTSILRRAIELGGHIKTGLELFYDPARNPTNLELLQLAQEIARDVGRPIATHEQARALYRLG
jgi:hypothetical protein